MPDDRRTPMLDAMPAARALLTAVRRRLATIVCLQALSAGLVLSSAIVVASLVFGGPGSTTWLVGALAGGGLASAIVFRGVRELTPISVAAAIERRAPSLENLLFTAVAIDQHSRRVHALIARELAAQTESRVETVTPSTLVPVARATAFAATVAVGAAITWWGVGTVGLDPAPATGSVAQTEGGVQPSAVTIVVTPPAYTSQPAITLHDVAEIDVLEGSRVRIDVDTAAGDVQLVEAGQAPVAFQRHGSRSSLELVAERTRFLLMRFTSGEATIPDRLLALLVKPDLAPVVRIRQPARDLVFPEPRGTVALEIEATDDLALASLSLRYTRAFGSGESMTFQEGELPLRVERVAAGQWRARREISLEQLQLADGDTLVYRATTRDRRPGRDPSASDAYLLEVGKLAEVASAGFALPADKDRHALSQQMVIVKTERLQAERDRLSPAEINERSRMLAVEQRMVRAEFVFMTGGEVEDEVAEAEHSHELAEGRFENEGQVELLAAIREMSRAEARLNDSAIAPALESERAALKALQRAFDRRRYLLRTTPERARIDQARRLTGEVADARPWRRAPGPSRGRDDLAQLEVLAHDLAAAKRSASGLGSLAARLGAIDPNAPDVQKAALRLSAAETADDAARTEAIDDTLRLLADRGRAALAPTRAWVSHDAAAGRYADALRQGSAKP